jgi:hypothetical protein
MHISIYNHNNVDSNSCSNCNSYRNSICDNKRCNVKQLYNNDEWCNIKQLYDQ